MKNIETAKKSSKRKTKELDGMLNRWSFIRIQTIIEYKDDEVPKLWIGGG